MEWPSTNASDHESLLAFEEIRDELPHLDWFEYFRVEKASAPGNGGEIASTTL